MEDYCRYQQRILEAFPSFVPKAHPIFSSVLNQFISAIGLKSFWEKTFYGVNLQVAEFCRKGQQTQALALLQQVLAECYFWGNYSKKWWHLMRIAVNLARNLSSHGGNQIFEPLRRLIKLSTVGPEPWEGRNVAFCFVNFSLWSFQLGKNQKAMEQIYVALHADPDWGYPEYLIGWYGLLLEGIDPIPHFLKSVQLNRVYLQQLMQDPLCRLFPKIIDRVTSEMVKG